MQLDKPKDFCCLLVDVGPHMHSILPQVEQFVSHYVEAKLINKPAHEVALILLGSTGTRNEVNQEFLEQGHPGQYENISVVENLSTPNLGTLKTASCLERGTGVTDIYNGLLVVLDLFKKASLDRHIPEKHCVLVSNLACQSEPIDEVTLSHITENLQSIRLDVVCPDMELEEQNGQQIVTKAIRMANEGPITDMLTKLGLPGPQHAHSAAELLSLIRWKEVKPSATFDGLLTVGSKLAIPVKMFKKIGKESAPSLKSYTLDQGALTEVHYQRSYVTMKQKAATGKEGEDATGTQADVGAESDAEEVEDEDKIKAYKYGRSVIPVDVGKEDSLKFSVQDRALQLLGFSPRSKVPRYAFNKESIVVIANKDDPAAGAAVSALVRSMASKGQVAVVRMVRTNNGKPELMAFLPRLASHQEHTPDCWIANGLPFEQEVRWSSFPDLVSKAEHEPSQEQRDAAHSLVRSMDLSDVPLGSDFGPQELLRPEHVVNPVLHRFYACVAKRAMDSQAQLPPKESDPLRGVLQPNAQLLSRCDPELQRLKELFPMELIPEAKGTKRGREDGTPGVKDKVGVCVVNRQGLVFAAKHEATDKHTWQMPQGNIEPGEDLQAAGLRELLEETSIKSVRVLQATDHVYEYTLTFSRGGQTHVRQRWLLLHFYGEDTEVNFESVDGHKEYKVWSWMPLPSLPPNVVESKRGMYEQVSAQFLPVIEQARQNGDLAWRPS